MAEDKTRFQQHVEDAKKQKVLLAQVKETRERAARRFRAAANEMGKSRAGQDFMVGIFHLCAYNQTSVVSDPETSEVLPGATAYNDARRSVYVDIRKMIDPELRAKIEALAESGAEDEASKKEK